mgnify:CR=1 FL=1
MGQKVNPHGLRVGVIKDWDSRWFARDNAFGDILVEDYNLRKFLNTKLNLAAVPIIFSSLTAIRFASTSTVPVPVSLSVRAARRLKSCALSARPW